VGEYKGNYGNQEKTLRVALKERARNCMGLSFIGEAGEIQKLRGDRKLLDRTLSFVVDFNPQGKIRLAGKICDRIKVRGTQKIERFKRNIGLLIVLRTGNQSKATGRVISRTLPSQGGKVLKRAERKGVGRRGGKSPTNLFGIRWSWVRIENPRDAAFPPWTAGKGLNSFLKG